MARWSRGTGTGRRARPRRSLRAAAHLLLRAHASGAGGAGRAGGLSPTSRTGSRLLTYAVGDFGHLLPISTQRRVGAEPVRRGWRRLAAREATGLTPSARLAHGAWTPRSGATAALSSRSRSTGTRDRSTSRPGGSAPSAPSTGPVAPNACRAPAGAAARSAGAWSPSASSASATLRASRLPHLARTPRTLRPPLAGRGLAGGPTPRTVLPRRDRGSCAAARPPRRHRTLTRHARPAHCSPAPRDSAPWREHLVTATSSACCRRPARANRLVACDRRDSPGGEIAAAERRQDASARRCSARPARSRHALGPSCSRSSPLSSLWNATASIAPRARRRGARRCSRAPPPRRRARRSMAHG